mgnify:CR=1 FL=1|nr:MAG TPA: homing endonuclease [Caudoviricetes sp.]
MAEKFQYYNGVKFTRDEKTGYYLNSTLRIRMHRFVWLCEKGDIPKGYDIHHIDHDKSNNDISNLALVTKKQHSKLHYEELSVSEKQAVIDNMNNNARPKAIEWHKSEEGKKWHSEMVKQAYADGRLGSKKFVCTCKQCGKQFFSSKQTTKWCSGACASKHRRDSGVDTEVRTCCVCGKSFSVNKYSHSTTCSASCRNVIRAETLRNRKINI